ncbi:hypothetical protein GJU39_05265 [Pedobacter petrophilus]|uniref:SCP domain-containing protein n=1 Tax=Pedobacter petrophilus TaxID=1908241 RepID=A0A7K0FWN8_9SPHI|nr:CAP domain-containing protein [Pedobacter petrophilus]MRX75494.1 hypothetical protein [Pedobacter petrophilus]
MKLIFRFLVFFVLLLSCKKSETLQPQNDLNLLLQEINLLRQSGCNCGTDYMPPVPPLQPSALLDNAAMAHAKDVDQRSYFAHISPEGTTPEERAMQAGYKGNVKGENLGKGYTHSDQVINAWKNSVSHCKAIMDGNSTEIGIGFSRNYWVTLFGRP